MRQAPRAVTLIVCTYSTLSGKSQSWELRACRGKSTVRCGKLPPQSRRVNCPLVAGKVNELPVSRDREK